MAILTKRFYLIMFAGLAGGLSEIFWIGMYSAMTLTGGIEICRRITAAVIPAWAELSIAPLLGVVIHLVLSVLLAFFFCAVFVEPVTRKFGHSVILPGSIIILACIWMLNFFVILPVINPAFVSLLPFLITLASKMLFGWAMGAVLTQGFVETANRAAN